MPVDLLLRLQTSYARYVSCSAVILLQKFWRPLVKTRGGTRWPEESPGLYRGRRGCSAEVREGRREAGCCLTTHGLVGSGNLRLSYSSVWSQECAQPMILMAGGNVHMFFREGAVGGLAGGQEEVCAEGCHFPSAEFF